MSKPVIVIGGGDHAIVVMEVLQLTGVVVLGLCARKRRVEAWYSSSLKYFDSDLEVCNKYAPDDILIVNAIGSTRQPEARTRATQFFENAGYTFHTAIHPSAIISPNASIRPGAQVLAGALIQPNAVLGTNSIINSRAVIEHDCYVGKNSHIAPGVTMSGNVIVGENSHIGTGASIIQGCEIGDNCLVGASVCVRRNVTSGTTFVG